MRLPRTHEALVGEQDAAEFVICLHSHQGRAQRKMDNATIRRSLLKIQDLGDVDNNAGSLVVFNFGSRHFYKFVHFYLSYSSFMLVFKGDLIGCPGTTAALLVFTSVNSTGGQEDRIASSRAGESRRKLIWRWQRLWRERVWIGRLIWRGLGVERIGFKALARIADWLEMRGAAAPP